MGRWLNWKPPIFENALDYEPSKPTEPGFDGFDGAPPGESLKIEAALAVLNRAGVRILQIEGAAVVGIWSDRDGPEIRGALQLLKVTLPIRYRTRRVSGEGVSPDKLTAMEA